MCVTRDFRRIQNLRVALPFFYHCRLSLKHFGTVEPCYSLLQETGQKYFLRSNSLLFKRDFIISGCALVGFDCPLVSFRSAMLSKFLIVKLKLELEYISNVDFLRMAAQSCTLMLNMKRISTNLFPIQCLILGSLSITVCSPLCPFLLFFNLFLSRATRPISHSVGRSVRPSVGRSVRPTTLFRRF